MIFYIYANDLSSYLSKDEFTFAIGFYELLTD